MNFAPAAIFFDLDGTLVDSAPDISAALNRALAESDLAPVSLNDVRLWVGRGARRLVECALAAQDAPRSSIDAVLERFVGIYSRHPCRDSRLYAGVRETLQALTRDGYPLACVTNKPAAVTAPLLAALALDGCFSTVVAGGDVAAQKPAPDALIEAAARLGVAVSHCLMVGDSDNDVQAARRAGCPVAVVSFGYNHGADIRTSGADAVLDDFAALLPLLQEAA